MNEEEVGDAWTTLEPTADRRRRIDARVSAWLEAHDTSLAAEWIGLFRVDPLAALGLATASAGAILATPALVWLASVLV